MRETKFAITEGFQAENEAGIRKRMERIVDDYLEAQLAAWNGKVCPNAFEIPSAAK